ncbi:MAG: carbohydrate-binding family 9-like protein, partial [Lentisphaerae bacterium]|nr:carbohydrate-binding family 9-like protein [Lentisphaerota bacterium]
MRRSLLALGVALLSTHCAPVSLGTEANLSWNAGFEEVSPRTQFPEYWGMNAAYKGKVSMVEDAAFAWRGSRCVTLQQTGKIFVGMHAGPRFNVETKRDVVVSVWVKGKGVVSTLLYLYSQRPAYVGCITVGTWDVSHADWQEFRGTVTIPATSNLSKRAPEPVVKTCLAFHVTGGPIHLDETGVYWKGEEPVDEPTEAQAKTDPTKPVPHLITIPKTDTPPRIDGTLEPSEWDRAATVTGFHELGGHLAGRQTLVHITYDDTHLYAAFDSTKEGTLGKGGTGRDGKLPTPHDAVELWLVPPNSPWFQFYGVPGGGFLDLNESKKLAWDGNWAFANQVTDVGGTAGEIQTFSKKRWTAEVAIPFADLGVSLPAPGDEWKINFCRDWSEEKGTTKKSEDWTTWSYINGSFATPGMFSTARFGGDSPAFQLNRLGDLPSGNLDVAGAVGIRPGDAVTVTAELLLRDASGKTVYRREQPCAVAVGGLQPFGFSETIRLQRTTDMTVVVRADDTRANRELARIQVPFAAASSFTVKPLPIFAKGFMDVAINAERLPGLPEAANLLLDIPGTALKRKVVIQRATPKALERFDLSEIAPGRYLVRAELRGPAGTLIASSSEPLTVPKRPEWLDNTIGITDRVPPPWTPLNVADKTVAVSLREYRLGDNGLPQQIHAAGQDILAAPITMAATVNGEQPAWEFAPLRLLSSTERRATWAVQGKAGPLALVGTLWTEFDGFSLLTFDLTGAPDVTLDALVIEVPMKASYARYARGRRQLPPGKFVTASLYPDTFASARDVDIGDHGTWLYSPSWKWQDTMFNELFVGGDIRGLAFLTESDQYIRGPAYADFTRTEDTVVLRISLISTPTLLSKPLHYEYGYIATPVKPRPKDPIIHQPSYFATDKYPEFIQRSCVAVNYHILANINTPRYRHPQGGKALVKRIGNYGVPVVADTYMSAASTTTPEYALFSPEWDVLPRDGWVVPTGRVRYACQSTSHAQFYLDSARRMVEEMGLGGVYIDVSGPMANRNPYSGCGYIDDEGERRPTVPLWASRKVFQRLYTYLHTDGRNGIIYSHTTHDTCIGGYVDVVTEGENWGTEGKRQYTRLSPDMFRAGFMKTQLG